MLTVSQPSELPMPHPLRLRIDTGVGGEEAKGFSEGVQLIKPEPGVSKGLPTA